MDQSAIVARRGLPLDSTTAIEIGWTVESYMQAHRSMAEGGPGSRRGTCVSAAAKTTVAGETPEEEGELRRGGARALHMLTGHIACLLTSTQSAQGGSARSHGSARTRGTLGGRTPGEVVLPRCKRAQPAGAMINRWLLNASGERRSRAGYVLLRQASSGGWAGHAANWFTYCALDAW